MNPLYTPGGKLAPDLSVWANKMGFSQVYKLGGGEQPPIDIAR